jgi:hypothetical protein
LALASCLGTILSCSEEKGGPPLSLLPDPSVCLPRDGLRQAADALKGRWSVSVTSGTVFLRGCRPPGDDGRAISIDGGARDFEVSGIPIGESFPETLIAIAPGPDNDAEMVVYIRSVYCIASALLWEKDERLYLACEGSFDPAGPMVSGTCTEAQVPSPTGGIETFCAFDPAVHFRIDILP